MSSHALRTLLVTAAIALGFVSSTAVTAGVGGAVAPTQAACVSCHEQG
jgi:nitrate/TMAO reductase-like tetraheme cytochrome c subunit